MTLRCAVAGCLMTLALLAAATAAGAQEIVHGADSVFVAPTVTIGWAVLRDANEEGTTVVVRVANSADAYAAVGLDGIDPFTKARKVLVPVRSLGRKADLVVPRAGFAEFPSCEVHLYRGESPSTGQVPTLTVFYLGVPDTTPEFTTRRAMDAYLERVLGAGK
jgi:hypothetical protein